MPGSLSNKVGGVVVNGMHSGNTSFTCRGTMTLNGSSWRIVRRDIAALDILNGEHQPGTSFKFIEESKSGTSPKFVVEDAKGAKWKMKLGYEVKSETAATCLV
jgi:hypothetical protein